MITLLNVESIPIYFFNISEFMLKINISKWFLKYNLMNKLYGVSEEEYVFK